MVGRTIARSQSMTAAASAAAGERLLAGVLAEGDFDITVTPDDDSGVAEGDEVTFTIEAINNGDEAADVDVTHAVPAGFEHVCSDPEGEAVGQEMV